MPYETVWVKSFSDMVQFGITRILKTDKQQRQQQRGRVISASDSRSGVCGFDSRPCRVAIALGKQFTLTYPSPLTCKMGTQLQAFLEFEIMRLYTMHIG
ncbi:hypothetical protein ElyMa_002136100 [Elysia marginata]|uniref:Uncharacterized protein n=1 Tax=Elysia marginata TaxID=1093978 RepID=A0AAV4FM59_9GAST|nr:hypothetical protein ElyMa_002136100 [Elysia marginata]